MVVAEGWGEEVEGCLVPLLLLVVQSVSMERFFFFFFFLLEWGKCCGLLGREGGS